MVHNKMIKLVQYADDTTGILANMKSVIAFLKTVEKFGKFSGLKLNREKTEAMNLGNFDLVHNNACGIRWLHSVKILGIYFSYNEK